MLLSDDADGFNDRQLFDFPPERNVHLDDFIPIPVDVPDLSNVFMHVMDNHSDEVVYTITDDGMACKNSRGNTTSLLNRKNPQMTKMFRGSCQRLEVIWQGQQ